MGKPARQEVGTVETSNELGALIGAEDTRGDQPGRHPSNAQPMKLAHRCPVLYDVKLSVGADVFKTQLVNLPEDRAAL